MSSPSAVREAQPLCHLEQLCAFLRRAAAGRVPGNRAIEVASQLQKQELLDHIDLGDLCAVARKDSARDDRPPGAAAPRARGCGRCPSLALSSRLRPDAARRQLEGDDHLFQARARLFGETRTRGSRERARPVSGACRRWRALAGALALANAGWDSRCVCLVMALTRVSGTARPAIARRLPGL